MSPLTEPTRIVLTKEPFKALTATGGDSVYDIVFDGVRYRVHVFTTVGNSTFTISAPGTGLHPGIAGVSASTIEYLVVAGGGGGGTNISGGSGSGGGAGGVLSGIAAMTPANFSVLVGAGGVGSSDESAKGANGGNSSLQIVGSTLTAIGGGGGSSNNNPVGASGGSGGGSQFNFAVGAGTDGQGNSGRSGDKLPNGGGGGGAGEPGGFTSLLGGIGIASSISGTSIGYAAGGQGHFRRDVLFGGSGLGATATLPATNGQASTGSGGGAGRSDQPVAGSGGSGIVIVRYAI